MLANLSLSGCYKHDVMAHEARDCIMLKSAKQNLRQMAFFGLTEYQHETKYLFERTFGLKFRKDFIQYNRTHSSEVGVTLRQQRRIRKLNTLDMELYRYANNLFFQRLKSIRKEDFMTKSWHNNGNLNNTDHDIEFINSETHITS
jgi:hypothetical protein